MAKKILIADDDPVVIVTLKTILERNHYEVSSVTNGQECLKRILKEKPDLLLLDILMPQTDGYSLLVFMKEIKEMTGEMPDIPVIVITGRIDASLKDLVGKENIKDYLLKPFDSEELLLKIKKLTA